MNKTELVMIVDQSGSMCGFEKDTIGGLNSFIKEQKAIKDSKANFSLLFFSNKHNVVYDSVDIQEIEEIDSHNSYRPAGSTALLDTIGFAIETLKAKKEGEEAGKKKERKIILDKDGSEESTEKVIFGIITDGGENASTKYNKEQILKLIEEQKAKGWEFIFLSSDVSAVQDAKTFGVNQQDAYSFHAGSEGFVDAYNSITDRVTFYRSDND
jgi:hypothetical protein